MLDNPCILKEAAYEADGCGVSEHRRYGDCLPQCGDASCTAQTTRTASSGRVFFGVEFGWTPGLVLSIGGGLALGLAFLAYAGSD